MVLFHLGWTLSRLTRSGFRLGETVLPVSGCNSRGLRVQGNVRKSLVFSCLLFSIAVIGIVGEIANCCNRIK